MYFKGVKGFKDWGFGVEDRVRVGGWGSCWGLGFVGIQVGVVITLKAIDVMNFILFFILFFVVV
jgi:hypothetical protein